MSKFKPTGQEQIFLFPPSINDFIPESHLARVIKEIVDRFDTKKIEQKYSEKGQKSYSPKLIISILIYGYAVGVRSGRQIAKKCEEDMAFMYLSSMYKPDFRTINDFRKDNLESFKGYFVDVLKICGEMGMVNVGTIAVDGMKCRANASPKRSKTKKQYEKWLSKLKEQVQELLAQAAEQDEIEDAEHGGERGDELPKQIRKTNKLIAKIEATIEKIKLEENKRDENKNEKKNNKKSENKDESKNENKDESKDENKSKKPEIKINLTDPDAKFIKDKGVNKTNYNGQIAVTAQGIITGRVLTNNPKEDSELIGLIEQTEQHTGGIVETTLADAGFSSFHNYEWFEQQKKECFLPDSEYARSQKKHKKNSKTRNSIYPKSEFIYDKENDEYTCPEGKKVKRTNSTDKQNDRKYNIYKCTDCEDCPMKNKCTKAKFRKIKREVREDIKDRALEKLKTPEGQKKYRERAWMVESKFGHFKHNLGYTMFNLRSLKKVAGEFDLICLANNIFKIYQEKLNLTKMLAKS